MKIPPLPQTCAWLPALREPARVLEWTLPEWEQSIRLARRLRLLARLGEAVAAELGLERVPADAARHLLAEMRRARWQTGALVWAAERVASALADPPYPVVLLKGAAYVADGLSIGRGRLPSDLDILVPRAHLDDAQARLTAAGWRETALDAHDRRYYHEWSHEVPPLRHPQHGLELDLHHNILPPVARLTVDAQRLLERVRPTPWPGWHALDPVDQILHSAAHLFQDSDLTDRLRDLVDLDMLCRMQAGAGAGAGGFWSGLTARALELGLGAPLWLALVLLQAWFDHPVPDAALQSLHPQRPGALQRRWLLPALAAALTPVAPDAHPGPGHRVGARVVLMRYHLGRMPLRLLLPHAWHKLRAGRAKPLAQAATDAPRPMQVEDDA